MKPKIFFIMAAIVAAAVGWLVHSRNSKAVAAPVIDFDKDDTETYNTMRSTLIAAMAGKYGAWFDDEVTVKYNSGSAMLFGKQSKTEAYYNIYKIYRSDAEYGRARTTIDSLYKNFKNRHK